MRTFVFEENRVVFSGSCFLIYDVEDLLPRHKNFPHGTDVVKPSGKPAIPSHWKYRKVDGREIRTLYAHQTAGSCSQKGWRALLNTFSFMQRDPAYTHTGKWTGTGRGWPAGAYTYFNAYEPEMRGDKAILFKCWDHDWVTWHSSDNHHSVAVVNQGYFKHPSIKNFRAKKGCVDGKPSDIQMEVLEAFIYEYAIPHIGISKVDIKGHCDSPVPKAACPGTVIDTLCQSVREGRALPEREDTYVGPLLPWLPGMLHLDSWEERQAALVLLGHNLGKYGKKQNGVDGDAGFLTKSAIETEEENLGLTVDGFWDDFIDYHVKLQLMARGITQEDIDELI